MRRRAVSSAVYLSPTTHGDRVEYFDAGRFLLFQSTYSASTALPRHYHENGALMFSTRGAFLETVARRTLECAAFDVIARPPGEAHSNRYEDGASCVIVNVTPAMIESFGTRLFEAPATLPRDVAIPIARRVGQEMADADRASPLVVEGLLLELIGEASRPAPTATAPRWLRDARDYLHAHWQEQPALADVAHAADVHPATLVRAFRRHLRCTPGEYLRRLRLEHARATLRAGDRSIAEVALEAGFYDQSHFTNAFRRAFGITPAQFLRRLD
jgi:AraC family transcriptional regulator